MSKMDYRKKGSLILTSLLEDLVGAAHLEKTHLFQVSKAGTACP